MAEFWMWFTFWVSILAMTISTASCLISYAILKRLNREEDRNGL